MEGRAQFGERIDLLKKCSDDEFEAVLIWGATGFAGFASAKPRTTVES
jgi:hypothetical protein